MLAFIDAYYATEPGPLIRLHEEFGVSHLVVDERHFAAPLRYFEPFQEPLKRRYEQARSTSLMVERLRASAAFEDGPVYVLELTR
jgi:hypothetical protein